ncbi:hypothetical protein [Streptomyces mirabilis]|uniref:hypothetical protein n=1 Tax=Streptomyces mirabilis TaxID=68239 RepID=UPI0035E09CCB
MVKPVRRYATARLDRDQLVSWSAAWNWGEPPEPAVSADRTTVALRAAPLNHHDPWTLEGVGIREEQQPVILGCDAAGLSCRPQEMAAFVAQSRKASGSSARACGCRADS